MLSNPDYLLGGGNMRAIIALSFLCAALGSPAADPAGENAITWQTSFSPVSPSEPFSMTVVLITSDDAFDAITQPKEDGRPLKVSPWCKRALEDAYRRTLRMRPDLKDRCVVQFLPAGPPGELTGRKPRSQPSRAIVAICDGNYRLLAMTVGVPDADEMLTMVEDAQQAHSILVLNEENKTQLRDAVAERSMTRLARLWREPLKQMLAAIEVGKNDGDKEPIEQLNARLGRIAASFEEVYLADVKYRFGLSEAADRTRLVILEQHPQTRAPWCEAMMPFVVGSKLVNTWIPLTEAVWQSDVIVSQRDHDDLIAWWDTQIKSDPVVLAITPPLLSRQQPWPPVDVGNVADKRGRGWKDLQQLLVSMPYRNVDSTEITQLIRERQLAPIDVELPTRARYLLYEPNKKAAWVIREGDIPGKHIGRINRAIKK